MSRCGEDERPLNELLILQLQEENPNWCNSVSSCRVLGKHLNQENRIASVVTFSFLFDFHCMITYLCVTEDELM